MCNDALGLYINIEGSALELKEYFKSSKEQASWIEELESKALSEYYGRKIRIIPRPPMEGDCP